jgi:septal ring factor EnvC (AmiA/AmiB activator)
VSQGEFGPGVRGVKLAAPAGSLAAAPAPGTVRFAGAIAGLGWVTVEVEPGVLVSVGPLDRIAVRAGAQVGARTVLGRLHADHDRALHLGLRVGGAYVDPLPHLARVGPPRLVPLARGDPG